MPGSISRNAIVAVVQVFANGVMLFLLYRFLLSEIGAAKLGAWSVVMAAASASKFAQLGFTGSTTKYVAKYLALNNEKSVARSIQTAVVSTMFLLGIVCVLAYPLLEWVLKAFIPKEGLSDALYLLPFALLSLWLGSLASIFQAGLDGCQRIDIRGYIMIISYVLYYVIAVNLVETLGLRGFAYAQIINGVVVLFLGWYALIRVMRFLPVMPFQWHRAEFREMAVYGFNFQLISLLQMMFEPVTKLFLGSFGGLSFAGYYEMANRMVLQLRTLLVAGNQVLVPVIADAHERKNISTRKIYGRSYKITFFLSAPFFCCLIALVPAISVAWIGNYNAEFTVSAILLSVGWWVNSISAPSYFSYLGLGKLRWPLISYLSMGIVNVVFGFILGSLYGGEGPVIAWALGLAVGSLLIMCQYSKEQSYSLKELLPDNSVSVFLMSLLVAIAGLLSYYLTESGMFELFIVIALAFVLLAAFFVFHPFGYVLRRILLRG